MATSVAIAALTHTIQTIQYVNQIAYNVTQEFQLQQIIDQKLLRSLQLMEDTIVYLGEKQEALTFCQSLDCDWVHKAICVTPLLWNNPLHNWEKI